MAVLALAAYAPDAPVALGDGRSDPGRVAAPTEGEIGSTPERLRRLQPERETQAGIDGLPDVTGRLSAAQGAAVAAHLKPCLPRIPDDQRQASVPVVASFDQQGRVWRAELRQVADAADLAGPDGPRKAWIARVLGAATDPSCNPLPLPVSVLGTPGRINLRY